MLEKAFNSFLSLPVTAVLSPPPLNSEGSEIVNALALFLLVLLDLFVIGRQERLKRREVERRLRNIISRINGEDLSSSSALFVFLHVSYFPLIFSSRHRSYGPHGLFLQLMLLNAELNQTSCWL